MHVSRVITWSLLTLEHQTWSNDQSQHDLSWWCQFIDYLKFETRPSSLNIWVRWTPRLGRGASVFPVIIVETLSKFFFPSASMLISKTFVPKQTREANIAGRGGKRDTLYVYSWKDQVHLVVSGSSSTIMNGIVGRDAMLSVWQITEFWLNL